MSLETLIRDAVADHTAGPVPEPDLDAIMRTRRPDRPRVRLLPVLGTAAAGVAIIAAAFVAQERVDIAPEQPAAPATTPTVTEAAPFIPQPDLNIYLVGEDKVSIGGKVYRRTHGLGRRILTATRFGLVAISGDMRVYLTRPDGTDVRLSERLTDSGWRPSLVSDPDGTTVAWTSIRENQVTAHVYDLAEQREVGAASGAGGLIGLDGTVLVTEVPTGGGSSYLAWDASRGGDFEWLPSDGRFAVVGVASHTIYSVGPGLVSAGDSIADPLRPWQSIALSAELTTRNPDDYVLAPDGRTYLRSIAGGPITAVGIRTGESAELAIDAERVGEPELSYDGDGSPLVLTRVAGRKGWSLYECEEANGSSIRIACELRESGIKDAAFPRDINYEAPFPY